MFLYWNTDDTDRMDLHGFLVQIRADQCHPSNPCSATSSCFCMVVCRVWDREVEMWLWVPPWLLKYIIYVIVKPQSTYSAQSVLIFTVSSVLPVVSFIVTHWKLYDISLYCLVFDYNMIHTDLELMRERYATFPSVSFIEKYN